jgi:hypothetical protein
MAFSAFIRLRKDLTFRSFLFKFISQIGGVAQLVEQRNHNPRVRGSSPCAATIEGGAA